MLKQNIIHTDFCVIGGGLAGMCAAIRAAREGAKVVLMHERPVFGGNASSEIRMWICGSEGENNRETGIVEEICLENMYRNPTKNYYIWDTILYDFIRREKNITPLLNCTCMDAEIEEGEYLYGRNRHIKSVTGYQMTTQMFYKVVAKNYADCSGDSILAPLTGAEFMLGRENAADFGEDTDRKEPDNMVMGMSCLIQGRETDRKIRFIPPEWSRKLTEDEKKLRRPNMESSYENFWYMELGGDRDTISDTEKIKDELLDVAMGVWDYVKNSYDKNMDNWELEFLGFLPGKRESRRMIGEYVLTQRDIIDGKEFEDAVAYGGWPIDDHFPGGFFYKGTPNTITMVNAPYNIPYRCLYSKNVNNLFFAGRNISVTHLAMSSTRVMATCALVGEAVGAAAAIAAKNNVSPNGVYLEYMETLQQLILRGDCFIPGKKRKISDLCKQTTSVPVNLKLGADRNHIIYKEQSGIAVKNGNAVEYVFENEEYVCEVHIVFDSDLNRETLDGDICERTHSMRANIKLDSPDLHMPKTLCRNFEVWADGEMICKFDNNRKRSYNISIDKKVKKLSLIPISNWGDIATTNIISFDF